MTFIESLKVNISEYENTGDQKNYVNVSRYLGVLQKFMKIYKNISPEDFADKIQTIIFLT